MNLEELFLDAQIRHAKSGELLAELEEREDGRLQFKNDAGKEMLARALDESQTSLRLLAHAHRETKKAFAALERFEAVVVKIQAEP